MKTLTSLFIFALAITASAQQQLAELTAPDPSAGTSVLLVSQGVAMGAPQANEATGAVYLYKVPQGGWQNMSQPSATLTAPDGLPGDEFGASIVTAGSHLIIGAPGAGKLYVYVNLVLTQEITGGCGLGSSLSTSLADSKKLLAAMPLCNVATLYEFINGQWAINQQIQPAGTTVAIGYGEALGYLTLAAGIPSYGGAMGKVIMGGSEEGQINGDAEDFGSVISMQQSSNLLFVGEPAEGKVLVYYAPNHAGHPFWEGGAQLVATLTDFSLGPNSGFGSSISARGKDMLIGAPGASVVDLFIQQPKMWASSDTPATSFQGVGGGSVAFYVGKAPSFIVGEPGAGVGFVVGR